ncbi:MAG: PAS domain S-box protein [Deltaproteobacteria bacterium]|nr:PAS domain S-box protein [Deltaproteobacteria bacterium]
MRGLKVLIAEDLEDDALLILMELRRHGFDPVSRRVDTREGLVFELEAREWDVIITDYSMPGLSGLEVPKAVEDKGLGIPVIVISGVMGEEFAVEAMKAGASDYIRKGSLSRLAPAIERELKEAKIKKEHREAVKALKESEERLRTIFESSMDGMFVIDTQGRYLDVNFAGCHMFGYTREEILSSDINLLIYPENSGRMAEHKAYWKKGAYLPEVRMRKKDGSPIWVDLAITPFNVGDRELALGVKRDITERKRAEEGLKESEERFRQIFGQSEDAQLILNRLDCRVIDVNGAAISLYGYTREEMLERGCSLLLGKDCEKILNGAEESRGFRLERSEARKKDGTRILTSVRGQLIKLRQNDVVYCTVRDLTEVMRLEEERRVIQAKLIHANKMTSLGTLASGVAHEINNPNNFILFNSTLLTDAWKDGAAILEAYYRENGDFSLGGLPYSEMRDVIPELLLGITDGSRRIKGIVDNLKDFSRAGKAGVDGECDVNRAVMAASSILGNQISKYTDGFHVSCSDNIPVVKGNEQKIEQVIINLIINALHALPHRGRGVWVTTASAGKCVEVKVRDEGIGMSKEVLDRITEPFFTTKTDTGGTGLGLSISYTIIKEHGGALEFDSEPGRGTTVTIKLPAQS